MNSSRPVRHFSWTGSTGPVLFARAMLFSAWRRRKATYAASAGFGPLTSESLSCFSRVMCGPSGFSPSAAPERLSASCLQPDFLLRGIDAWRRSAPGPRRACRCRPRGSLGWRVRHLLVDVVELLDEVAEVLRNHRRAACCRCPGGRGHRPASTPGRSARARPSGGSCGPCRPCRRGRARCRSCGGRGRRGRPWRRQEWPAGCRVAR